MWNNDVTLVKTTKALYIWKNETHWPNGQSLLNLLNMRQIILVPTDFSNNSLTATYYALELAQNMHVDIHILHAYRPFTSAFQSPLANQTDEQRARLGAEKGLAYFTEKLGND